MKIVKKTPEQIVLRFIPGWNWLAGSVCLTVALFFLGISSLSHRLLCDRSAPDGGQCKLITSLPLLVYLEQELNLSDIEKAEIQATSADSKNREYSVVLLTNKSEVILYGKVGHMSANWNQKKAIASQINAFLKNQSELSPIIEEKSETPLLLIGVYIFHILLGGLIIIYPKIEICKVDKSKNCLEVIQVGLLARKRNQYDLSPVIDLQVEDVQLNKSWFHLILVLREDSPIYLTFPRGILTSPKKLAKTLKNFLNLPKD